MQEAEPEPQPEPVSSEWEPPLESPRVRKKAKSAAADAPSFPGRSAEDRMLGSKNKATIDRAKGKQN